MKTRHNRKISVKCNQCFSFNYQHSTKCRHCGKKFARRGNLILRILRFVRDEGREIFNLATRAYRKKRSISFDL